MPDNAMIVEEHGVGSTLTVDRSQLLKAASGLREAGFDLLLFVTAIDYPDSIKLVYRLYSTTNKTGILVKTEVPKGDPVIASLTLLWPSANWHERETYDLFGVVFEGHPNLKRIFMPEDWVGHPLRKDYSDDRMIVFPDAVKKEKPEAKEKPAVKDNKTSEEETYETK